jgi:hypothetical protein
LEGVVVVLVVAVDDLPAAEEPTTKPGVRFSGVMRTAATGTTAADNDEDADTEPADADAAVEADEADGNSRMRLPVAGELAGRRGAAAFESGDDAAAAVAAEEAPAEMADTDAADADEPSRCGERPTKRLAYIEPFAPEADAL